MDTPELNTPPNAEQVLSEAIAKIEKLEAENSSLKTAVNISLICCGLGIALALMFIL